MIHRIRFITFLFFLLTDQILADYLTLDDLSVNGMTISVRGQKLVIENLQIFRNEDKIRLVSRIPDWRGPVQLPFSYGISGMITRGSFTTVVNGRRLVEGRDFLVNYTWGTVGASPNSSIHNQDGFIRYQYTKSRLDLVIESAGQLQVIRGEPDLKSPILPLPPTNAHPLFAVYLPHNTTGLSYENINIFQEGGNQYGPSYGDKYIKEHLRKFWAGELSTIAFLGDSITAQTDPVGGGFVERFRDWTESIYEDVKYTRTINHDKGDTLKLKDGNLEIIMAGVNGDTSTKGLKRLYYDVLIHDPELVFIMFGVNDENRRPNGNLVPPDRYKENLISMVTQIRESGGEPVLMTPSMKNLDWSKTTGNIEEYADQAKQVAQDFKVCLVDHFKAWKDLPKFGYNYKIYLGSGINHPAALGHEMTFQGIRNLFDNARDY